MNNLIDYNDLQLGKIVGEGGFGKVYAGTYKGSQVAIKEMKHTETEHLEAFSREIWMSM